MRGRMIEVAGARLEVWREAVAYEALSARPRGWRPLVGPVKVEVEFRLHRPKRPQYPLPAAKGRNDLDKLLRAIGDALTGVAYEDYPAAKLIVVWGCNPSVSGIHLVPYIRRAQQAGTKLVVVDPRATPLARGSTTTSFVPACCARRM